MITEHRHPAALLSENGGTDVADILPEIPDGSTLFGLLDGALIQGLPEMLGADEVPARCLYGNAAANRIEEAAPWLADLTDDTGFRARLLARGDTPWHLWDHWPGLFLWCGSDIDLPPETSLVLM